MCPRCRGRDVGVLVGVIEDVVDGKGLRVVESAIVIVGENEVLKARF